MRTQSLPSVMWMSTWTRLGEKDFKFGWRNTCYTFCNHMFSFSFRSYFCHEFPSYAARQDRWHRSSAQEYITGTHFLINLALIFLALIITVTIFGEGNTDGIPLSYTIVHFALKRGHHNNNNNNNNNNNRFIKRHILGSWRFTVKCFKK